MWVPIGSVFAVKHGATTSLDKRERGGNTWRAVVAAERCLTTSLLSFDLTPFPMRAIYLTSARTDTERGVCGGYRPFRPRVARTHAYAHNLP